MAAPDVPLRGEFPAHFERSRVISCSFAGRRFTASSMVSGGIRGDS